MLQATHTAALGISSQQKRLDVISNNMANVNTLGFKGSNVNFKDALYQTMLRPNQPQGNVNLRLGHGTLVAGIVKDFGQGTYIETGVETDLYLEGDGFFSVLSKNGQRLYTRDGSFTKSVEADGTYLVTRLGMYVLDANGQKIRLQGESFNVSQDGYISEDGGQPYARIGVYNYPQREGLEAVSDNLFTTTVASGNPQLMPAQSIKITQKVLEGSNVNIGDQMTKLIRTQRIFSLNSKALTQADQMDGVANQLR